MQIEGGEGRLTGAAPSPHRTRGQQAEKVEQEESYADSLCLQRGIVNGRGVLGKPSEGVEEGEAKSLLGVVEPCSQRVDSYRTEQHEHRVDESSGCA